MVFVVRFERNYPKVIQSKQFKWLYQWIIDQTSYLNVSQHKLSTRLFWIFNDIKDWNNSKVQCKHCHQPLYNKNVYQIKNNWPIIFTYPTFCSAKCVQNDSDVRLKNEQTCLANYGVRISSQSDQAKRAYKLTCLANYGIDAYTKTQDFKLKSKQSKLLNHGDANYTNIEKRAKTNLKLYGNVCSLCGKEQIIKSKNTKLKRHNNSNWNNRKQAALTCKDRYGYENPHQNPQIIEKSLQTKFDKYGSRGYNNKEQSQRTCLDRYGVTHPMKNSKIRSKCCSIRYTYNNVSFDSIPEIAFYIWLIDNSIQFEYQPNVDISFIYNNIKHQVLPDFKINDQLYEIKGDHFIKEDGTWQCPFDHSLDDLYETKHQCLLQNNVIILTSKDYMKYIDYVNLKYGKHFLKSCKKVK